MVILAVGPHPDDVEIGCFGTLARRVQDEPVVILVMTSPSYRAPPERREQEAVESAKLIGAQVEFLRHPGGRLQQTPETVAQVRTAISEHGATTVFAPYADDTHQDHFATHRIVAASAAHIRDLLLYETPSTVGFRPNVYYDVTDTLETKKRAIRQFTSQSERPYTDLDLIEGQARYWSLRLHRVGRAFEAFSLLRSVR